MPTNTRLPKQRLLAPAVPGRTIVRSGGSSYMPVLKPLAKYIGAPLLVGGALHALNAPVRERGESLKHKWNSTRDAMAGMGGTAGLMAGHSLTKYAPNLPAKALLMALGGLGGAVAGGGLVAPAIHREDVRIRKARQMFPRGLVPATGAPVPGSKQQLDMDPSTAYKTERWGVQ